MLSEARDGSTSCFWRGLIVSVGLQPVGRDSEKRETLRLAGERSCLCTGLPAWLAAKQYQGALCEIPGGCCGISVGNRYRAWSRMGPYYSWLPRNRAWGQFRRDWKDEADSCPDIEMV